MKPKCIGIVGGAGPIAGSLLLEQVFLLAGKLYGCSKDSDFPEVFLYSFPFSDMLSDAVDPKQIEEELRLCLNKLKNAGATVVAIACNTLHAFLPPDMPDCGLIYLPAVMQKELPAGSEPLVLCTKTSRKTQVHKRFFPCVYPESVLQERVDRLIEEILKDPKREELVNILQEILKEAPSPWIILGCTELSTIAQSLSIPGKRLIDPVPLLAKELLAKSFNLQETL